MGIGRYYLLILLLVPILFSFSIPSAFAAEVIVPVGSSVPGCEDTNECWLPAEISVGVGETVVWSNEDTAAHTVTSGSAADGSDGNFDSGLFMAGTTFSWTAETAGEYTYYCAVHPWMAGVVIVGAAAQTTEDLTASIQTGIAKVGSTLTIDVAFTHTDGSATEHVNYDILAIQGTQVVLDEKGVHDHDGQSSHTTVALPSDDVVTIDITFNGFGIDPPFTGPVGQIFTFFVFVEPEIEPQPQVSVSVSNNSFVEGDTIVISGQVSVVIVDTPVRIQIFNLGNLIEIAQIVVAQDGSFTHTILAQGPQWQNEGEYVVRAEYGGIIDETTFQFFKIGAPSEISGFFEVDAGTGGTFDVGYTISGGTVKNMIVDSEIFALIVIIESTGDGSLTLDLPRESIDAKKSNGSDDLFIVLIDGIEVIYDEAITNENTRTLTIRFEAGDSEISILGTFIVNGGQPQPPEEEETEPEPGQSFDCDGNFMLTILVGSTWKQDGIYTIGIQQGSSSLHSFSLQVEVNGGTTAATSVSESTLVATVQGGVMSPAYALEQACPDCGPQSGMSVSVNAEEGSTTISVSGHTSIITNAITVIVSAPNGNIISVIQITEPSQCEEPEPQSFISVSTNKSVYERGEQIRIHGKVTNIRVNTLVTLTVISPSNNIVTIDQLFVSNFGDFETVLSTAGNLWKFDGTYTIRVQYGSEQVSDKTTIKLFGSTSPSPSSIRVSIPAGTSVPGCEDTRDCFIPFLAAVSRGGTVTWENNDVAAHTVTSGSPADGPNGIFDSSLIMAGATFSITFDQDGTFDYFCMLHPWMMGEIIVGEGGPTPIPPSVNVRTDRSTYHPGETIEVSGIVKHFDGRAVSLKIVNPFGGLVLVDQADLSSGGAFNEQYKIAGVQWTKSGSYTITVQAGSAKAQTEFFLRIPSTVPPPSQQTTEIVVARGSSVPGCEETNECFIPFEARVNVGDTVTWFNHDTAAHTVTSGSAANGPNGIFDSSLFMAGTEFSHTFDAAGEYEYFCMVHPWMAGVVLVGEGGPVTRPPSNISISVESDKSVYDLGDLVEIDVSISGINSREQVAITVTDRSGTAVISRTLTTDSSGHAELEFRIPEDFRTGTYLVSATSSIDGKTYKARDVFKIKSQFNQIRIVSVEPTNQQGQLSDFEVGELGFVKVVLDADKDIAVLITVNLFDSELTTLGIGSLKTTLNDGRTEMILSFMIPDDAALGEAEIFASVFSDWPRNGGIPLTPEVSAEVDIR